MIAKKCDRCGTYYEPLEDSENIDYEDDYWRYYIIKDNHPYLESKIDLCLNCRKELAQWIKEKK